MSQEEPENLPTEKQEETEDVEKLKKKIGQYEAIMKMNGEKIGGLETDLKKKTEEITECKKRITQLEEETAEAQKIKNQRQKDSEEVEAMKQLSEDTLTRAKSIIFDKTKVIKNQELQIEALNQQIEGLKDVVSITKDLLEIRNLEAKQLETKIKCMEDRMGAEKERQDLMHKKLEQMIRFNGDLKREYETQLCLFNALRERYSERELARNVVDELKAGNQNPPENGNNDEASGGGGGGDDEK